MAGNFEFTKLGNCTIHVVKTKALINLIVTAKFICAFVFAYAKCWFSHDGAQISPIMIKPYAKTKKQISIQLLKQLL